MLHAFLFSGIHWDSAELYGSGSVAVEMDEDELRIFASAAHMRAELGPNFFPRRRALQERAPPPPGPWDNPHSNPHVRQVRCVLHFIKWEVTRLWTRSRLLQSTA